MNKIEKVLLGLMGAVLFVTIGMLVFDIYGSYIPLTAFYLLWMFLGFVVLFGLAQLVIWFPWLWKM